MTRYLAVAVGIAAAAAVVAGGLLAPLEVRHSAPFGFRLTIDPERAIAVRGGFVAPNYPNFNRVDLDLRAYDLDAHFDLTVHVRPAEPGAADVRVVPVSLPGDRIRHDKATFADPFVTVRFAPIADSAGRPYYVWVEAGPRNRDDVVTLWSIKSYSRVTGRAVLAAYLADPPGDASSAVVRAVLVSLLLGLVGAFGWLMAALTGAALPPRRPLATNVRSSADSAEAPVPEVAVPSRTGARGPRPDLGGWWRPPETGGIHCAGHRAEGDGAPLRFGSAIGGRGRPRPDSGPASECKGRD